LGRSERQFWLLTAAFAFVVALAVAIAVWLGGFGESTNLWPMLTGILGAVAAGALVTAVRLVTWRRALDGGQTSIVPDQLLGDIASQRKAATTAYAAAETALRSGADALRQSDAQGAQILAALGVFQSSLTKKDAEIERLRDGGDAQVFRRFLRRFLRVHDALAEEIEVLAASGGDTAPLEGVRAVLEDALYDCGLEPLEPEIGADYRHEFGVAENPAKVPTDDPAAHFLIASVNRLGFQIMGPDGPEAIREAGVAIFIKQQPDADNLPDESGQPNAHPERPTA
jgi:hypothetical protein